MNDPSLPLPPLNRSAVISLTAAILALLSFCIAVAPIPLTGYVCFPATAVLGLVALVFGVAALVQMRASPEGGRTHALIGVWVGAAALVAGGCAITLGILLLPRLIALFPRLVTWLQQFVK